MVFFRLYWECELKLKIPTPSFAKIQILTLRFKTFHVTFHGISSCCHTFILTPGMYLVWTLGIPPSTSSSVPSSSNLASWQRRSTWTWTMRGVYSDASLTSASVWRKANISYWRIQIRYVEKDWCRVSQYHCLCSWTKFWVMNAYTLLHTKILWHIILLHCY